MKFDLGGIGTREGYKTVNLVQPCDILTDIMDLNFVGDNAAEEFFLSHTLEHIPVERYHKFIVDMKRKLRPGGVIRVIQSDAAEAIQQWVRGELSWRAMRMVLFTPANRIVVNQYNRHHNMWSAEELRRDFERIGMATDTFDAGAWSFDLKDELYPDDCLPYQGIPIKNLGVIARKIHVGLI